MSSVKISRDLLSFTAASDGYMLYYRGKPIGGVNVTRAGPLTPFRANQARDGYKKDALFALTKLVQGVGADRFITEINRIDAELQTETRHEP